jgi:uncharacterized membrane protein YhaH (DUF805 family)
MNWRHYLFGFDGRITRARYWLFAIVGPAYIFPAILIALPYELIEHPSTSTAGHPLSLLGKATIATEGLVLLGYLVSFVAISVKRLHDRNRSGWWFLLFLVLPLTIDLALPMRESRFDSGGIPASLEIALAVLALVLSWWGVIELGFLRGAAGPNRFGPDPATILPSPPVSIDPENSAP